MSGVATGAVSGLAVLDIDGESGSSSLCAIESEHGPLPGTVTSITGNGCHLLYRWPDRPPSRCWRPAGASAASPGS